MTTAQAVRPTAAASHVARTASGSLLITGFLTMVVQVVLFAINEGMLPIAASAATRRWDVILGCAGVTMMLMGLALFESVLAQAGGGVSARIGVVAYGLAAGVWILGETLAFTAFPAFVAPFEVYLIVASGVSVIAFATAVLVTRELPHWVGWVAWYGVVSG